MNKKHTLSKEQINSLVSLYSNGHFKEAISRIKSLNKEYPNVPFLFNLIGACYKDLGQLKDAVRMFELAIKIQPNYVDAYYNLGGVLHDLGYFNQAVKSYERSLAIKPNYAEANNNLGNVFQDLDQLDNAIASYKKALNIRPNFEEAHYNLGYVLQNLGKRSLAIICYEKAISIKPDYAQAHSNLGNVFRSLKKIDKALIFIERAYKMMPDIDYILGDLLNTKMHLCLWDGLSSQIKDLRNQINNNKKAITPFNLLVLIDDPSLHKKASVIYANDHYPESNVLPKIEPYSKHSKIRVGYFSADFKDHPVATLTAELYELHDRSQFEIHAFSFGPDTQDEMNLRIKAGVDHFHDVQTMSNKDTAMLARSLEIDIAIDLGGFTANSRTGIFAMRAAPIQASYVGYLGTMGASYYDYLIADYDLIPVNNQKHYVEKIVYMPSYQVNDSKAVSPKINLTRKELGLPEKGFVFCCFNNVFKLNPDVFDSWAKILKGVDGSVLFIFVEIDSAKLNLIKEIELRGIDSKRLIFAERLPRLEHLARYRVADLFLDTRPCNAGATASDALRMGLPILTLKGESFPSRIGSSLLNSVNIPELITTSPKEYESLAVELAINPEKLNKIKDKLTINILTAPLYDSSLYAKNLESAFKIMCESLQNGEDLNHISLAH